MSFFQSMPPLLQSQVKESSAFAIFFDATIESMTKEIETLGQRLARFRTDKQLTQQQLAKLSGVGQSTIACIESGARAKVPGSLIDIAHALGVDAYELKYGAKVLVANDLVIDEVSNLMAGMSREGKAIVLDKARDMAVQYPAESRKHRSN